MTLFSEFFDPSAISVMLGQFYGEVHHPQFWVALTEIIWINVLLSGDNALVIALACRGLAPRQRLWGMILGAGAAVVLRIIFTGIVATLMELPYLKLVGGLALIVIAAKLLVPEQDEEEVQSTSHLWSAVQIVVVADIVMSLDNVIAVAATANGSVPLLILGLAISVPLIVAGAALIMALLDPAADSDMGRSDAAGLDRRRRRRNRSGHSFQTGDVFRWRGRRQARRTVGIARFYIAPGATRQWRRDRMRRRRRDRGAGRGRGLAAAQTASNRTPGIVACGQGKRDGSRRRPGRLALGRQCVTRLGQGFKFGVLLREAIGNPLFVAVAGGAGGLLDQLPDIIPDNGDAVFQFGQ